MESKSRSVLPKRQKASAKLVDAILEQIGGLSVIKSFNLTGTGDEKEKALINLQFVRVIVEAKEGALPPVFVPHDL